MQTDATQLPLIYQAANGAIELRPDVDRETIWASQAMMSEIFWVDRTVITRHINNVFKDWELDADVVSVKFAHTTQHGSISNKTQTRDIKLYNLDLIISVWYRVNSKVATKFRQRATQTLRQHITQWYTINKSVIQQNYENFLTAVEQVKALAYHKDISSDEILELIKAFWQTRFSLDSFDKWTVGIQTTTQQSINLEAKQLYEDINILKEELIKKWEATDLFAQEKEPNNLAWILWNVFQSLYWEDTYPDTESKAAHLLYFIVKNHPFNDGNKRSGAFAFIWLLQKSDYPYRLKITPEALAALTLLIATSDPKDKERIVGLVILLLRGKE